MMYLLAFALVGVAGVVGVVEVVGVVGVVATDVVRVVGVGGVDVWLPSSCWSVVSLALSGSFH